MIRWILCHWFDWHEMTPIMTDLGEHPFLQTCKHCHDWFRK